MPKPGVAHSQAERERAEIAHRETTGQAARPMPRADVIALLSVYDDDPSEVIDMVREVLRHGISPREVQALLARSYLMLGQQAAKAGSADMELQYHRLQARTLETIRKTVADHEEKSSVERLVVVIHTSTEDGPGDIIPVE